MYLTEQEILNRQQGQLYGIQKMIKNCQIDLDDITALIPGLVHLNKVHTLDLIYLDKHSRGLIEVKKEDLATDGARILQRHVRPESLQQAKMLFGKNDFSDPSQIISHFQALKGFSDSKDYQWYFSVKKRFDKNLIMTVSNAVSTLGPMQQKLEKILEENLFIKKNLPKLNSLTPREKEIIKLILKGYNTKQIAEALFISAHTVSTHRKNIWHKLEISSYTELYKFAGEFDLV